MAPWQFWKLFGKQQCKSRPQRRTHLALEALEDRSLMSVTVLAPGYNMATFTTSPTGASQPDSIAVDGLNVYVGYQNGAAKDGSSGFSTIAQFTTTGPMMSRMTGPTRRTSKSRSAHSRSIG